MVSDNNLSLDEMKELLRKINEDEKKLGENNVSTEVWTEVKEKLPSRNTSMVEGVKIYLNTIIECLEEKEE